MKTRREFIKMSALAGTAIAGASVATSSLAGLPEPVIQTSAETISPNKTHKGVKKKRVKDKPARVFRSKLIEKKNKLMHAVKNKIG